jgi:hypothetical protein
MIGTSESSHSRPFIACRLPVHWHDIDVKLAVLEGC